MKKILIAAAVATAALSTGAQAADMAARTYTKAPAPMVQYYDWAGFYLGANAGGAWSRKCWDNLSVLGVPVVPAVAEGCHDASGGTVGGQIGYRWQSAAWVFGLEAQGNWADLTGSNISLGAAVVTNRTKIDALALFTGQVGYSWTSFLLYVKGGAALTNDKYTGLATATGIAFDQSKETRFGGAVGVGGEYAFSRNWSAGLEYMHLFMGEKNVDFTGILVPVASRTDRIRQDVDMVTLRLNYRFNDVVVAKY